jgi:hypothetical protein
MALFSERVTKRPCEDDQSNSPLRTTNTTTENTKPYLQSDYPLIKYWTRQQWKDSENNNKDASDILEVKNKTRGGTRSAKGENVMMLYIEHEDGTPIDGNMAAQVREHARLLWKDLYHRGKAPEKWTDASRDVRDEYFREMEERWQVLRYCDNHWKANKLATALYSIWYNPYHKKAAKIQGGNPHEGRPIKKARMSSADLEDSPEPEDQGDGRAASESPIADHGPESTLQTENRETSQPSSRPKPRPLQDPL